MFLIVFLLFFPCCSLFFNIYRSFYIIMFNFPSLFFFLFSTMFVSLFSFLYFSVDTLFWSCLLFWVLDIFVSNWLIFFFFWISFDPCVTLLYFFFFFGLFWLSICVCVCLCVSAPLFLSLFVWFCFYHLSGIHFLFPFFFFLYIFCSFLFGCNSLYCQNKTACRILVPQQELRSEPLGLESWVQDTRPPGTVNQ